MEKQSVTAIELHLIKTPRDDVTRGLGQLTEAIAFGYNEAAMVTTLSKAKRIDLRVFDRIGFLLLAVESDGKVRSLTDHSCRSQS